MLPTSSGGRRFPDERRRDTRSASPRRSLFSDWRERSIERAWAASGRTSAIALLSSPRRARLNVVGRDRATALASLRCRHSQSAAPSSSTDDRNERWGRERAIVGVYPPLGHSNFFGPRPGGRRSLRNGLAWRLGDGTRRSAVVLEVDLRSVDRHRADPRFHLMGR